MLILIAKEYPLASREAHLPKVVWLKIDRSFVNAMAENHNDEAIVRAAILMAHQMELTVVAEGIEDTATLNRLKELNCDTGQGIYSQTYIGGG